MSRAGHLSRAGHPDRRKTCRSIPGASSTRKGPRSFAGPDTRRPPGAFLQFLASRPLIAGGPSGRPVEPDVTDLLADLLGATLVDARDELLAAWEM